MLLPKLLKDAVDYHCRNAWHDCECAHCRYKRSINNRFAWMRLDYTANPVPPPYWDTSWYADWKRDMVNKQREELREEVRANLSELKNAL